MLCNRINQNKKEKSVRKKIQTILILSHFGVCVDRRTQSVLKTLFFFLLFLCSHIFVYAVQGELIRKMHRTQFMCVLKINSIYAVHTDRTLSEALQKPNKNDFFSLSARSFCI